MSDWETGRERDPEAPKKPFNRKLPICTTRLWPEFDDYLRSRDLDYTLARKNLWYPSLEIDGYPRVVVPATSDQPGNVYWQARLMALSGPTSPQETTLSPRRWESPHGVSRGDAIVLVWPNEIKKIDDKFRSVVVEGPFDALAAAGLGYRAVGLMGSGPPEACLDLTAQLLRGTITLVVFDADQPEAMIEVMKSLMARGLTCGLRSPYPGKDLAELPVSTRKLVLL